MIKLREYQEKLIEDARIALRSHKGVLLRSPTGSGKTAVTSFMLKSASDKGKIVWFVVHREELIKQSSAAFLKVGLDHSFVAAGYPCDTKSKVQICSVMSLSNRLDMLPTPDMIVYDECQYMAARTWDKIFDRYPSSFHIGLSATPHRLDKKGFKKYFQYMVNGPSVEWLIKNNFLSDYRMFAPTNFDSSGLKTSMGDYDLKNADEIFTNQIVGNYYEVWRKHAFNKKTIVFAPNVIVSKRIVAMFSGHGISACHLDAETKKQDRDQAIKDYAAGKITVLSNVRLFTEGFDVPSIECVMLSRPTKSLALYLQMVGRALRPQPGKTHAIILDQVNSCREHGLPDDNYEWTLEDRRGKKKKKDSNENDVNVKVCPTCFAANNNFNKFCISCGYEFEVKGRSGPEEVDGELSEIDKEKLRKQKESKVAQGRAQTIESLIALGKQRGYKNPAAWARNVLKGRELKNARK